MMSELGRKSICSIRHLARKYGISDIAVRKCCKRMGVALSRPRILAEDGRQRS
jgi:hypothetical protein